MHEKAPNKPKAGTSGAPASRSAEFSLVCDSDGYIFAVDPTTGDAIQGTCTDLVTEKTENGVKVTQVTMNQGVMACVWRKVGGRWVCV